MCAVSVIQDYARTVIDPQLWTRPVFNEYHEIIRRLGELDAKLGQPDCEDPAKAAWMRDIEERLSKIEAVEYSQK